jgi:hypothetical protein
MLASVSLFGGEFISLIPFASLLPSPDGVGGSGDKRFFFNDKNDRTAVFSIETRGAMGAGVSQRVGRQR